MKDMKKIVSLLLTAALMLTTMVCGDTIVVDAKAKVKVSKVKITNVGKKLRLQKGKKFRLRTSINVKPNKKSFKKIKFFSSNRKVVLINSRGLLKGMKAGTAKITAASKADPKKKAVISVQVTKDVLVSSIKLNKTKISVDEFNEEEIQLKVNKILPANAKNKKVKWSSSDENVADVDDDGMVTTGDVGTATITVMAADQGGAYATCKVIVNENNDAGSDDDDEETEIPPTPKSPDQNMPSTNVPTPDQPTEEPGEVPDQPTEEPGEATDQPTEEPGEATDQPAEKPGEATDRPTEKPGGTTATVPPASTDAGQATEAPDPTFKPTRSPKPPTALPKNAAVSAHKLGKGEKVTVNGAVDKWANGAEWENTTDKEIDLLANKEVSLRGTSAITAAKAFLMWADEADNGENALYAIVKVTKPGTPGSSDKVTLFLSEDGKRIVKVEAVVGSAATDGAAAAVSKATDLGGVDGYIAELRIPLSKAYAVDTDKLKIDIMISDGDATINYFDTMTEYKLKKDADGNIMVDENNRNIAVPAGPAVSVDNDAFKMGDAVLIASMAVAAKAYKTASGDAIRKAADYENNPWDWEIPATPDPFISPDIDAAEAPAPTDNGIKSKAMKFVDTRYWTDVYKANESESIAFPNVNDGSTGGYMVDGNITLADKITGEDDSTSWEASREKVQSYIIWDDGYVYVLFDVNDPDITALNPSGDYQSDSVEFFLDQDYSAPKSYATDGTGDEVQFRVVAANNQFAPNDAGTGAYELVAHAVAYKGANGTYVDAYNSEGVTGYQVEMIIKLQSDDKHKTPKDGDIMGMDLQINDCYTKYQYEEKEDEFGDKYQEIVPGSGVVTRGGILTVFDTTKNAYQNPSYFGRVKLLDGVQGGGEPGPGPAPEPGPGGEADVEARFTSSVITIDGEKETAWNSAPALKVANAVPGGVDENTPATARLLWDVDNLYVLITVRDADIDTSSANEYQRDGGEVFLDEDNSKEDTYTDNTDAFQYRFTGMAKDGSGAATHAIISGSETAKTNYAGITSAYKILTSKATGAITGYQIEHKIPWKGEVRLNQIVGFELAVFDCSNGTRNKEYYLINTADIPKIGDLWKDPSPMGTLKLVESVATLPWEADLSQMEVEDNYTKKLNDDGSLEITGIGQFHKGSGISLAMPAKFDGTPTKCTVYVDTLDADGKKITGGVVKWAEVKDSNKYNWSDVSYTDTALDMNLEENPSLTLLLDFQPPDYQNGWDGDLYKDVVRTFKISKIVVQ